MIVFAFSKGAGLRARPYSYSQLIWAAAAGWLVFGSLPDGWTIVGGGMIAASGV